MTTTDQPEPTMHRVDWFRRDPGGGTLFVKPEEPQPMTTGPEPGPTGFTPYDYAAVVRQALHDHAPAGKTYAEDGTITKVCRCGLETDGSTLTARTEHLGDVVTAALGFTSLPTRAEVLRVADAAGVDAVPRVPEFVAASRLGLAAALNALHEAGLLPWREGT
jgi:hypothetical protein